MEDSGIDSGDRQSILCDEESTESKHHMDDLEVIFRSSTNCDLGNQTQNTVTHSNSRKTQCQNDENAKNGVAYTQPPNTCRILQRKLELKVERAKRNYSQYHEEQAKKLQSATLVPINRLQIPGDVENKPLVDYKSDESDEADEISFFPAKRKALRNPELSDTFSIQEMTIESEEQEKNSDDSDASQNLQLLPPLLKSNWFDKLKNYFTSCTSSFCS